MDVHRLADLDPLRLARGLATRDGTVLLHGQVDWHERARSYLLFDPLWTLRATRNGIVDDAPAPPGSPAPGLARRLEQLRALVRGSGHDDLPAVAGFLGYEAGSSRFDCRHPVAPPTAPPDAWFGVYDAVLAFGDPAGPRLCVRDLSDVGGPDPSTRARELLDRVDAAARPGPGATGATGPWDMPDARWHREAVRRIQEHLREGDSYQVNLTGFASAETAVEPFEHFIRHGRENPVAFAAFLQVDGTAISSHSPERLLRVRGDRADTAPIKGTVASAPGAAERLRASEKDRAEHLMIVDLCRNDLGRRAREGSVRVAGLMETLELRGIVHLVSRIEARVRPGAGGALLDSLFPGGSITGAPKRRSMEIVTAVESSGRGPYTGSIGYLRPDGDLEFSIAIRTAVWREGRVHFGCGGGIVVESDPRAEYEEARLKAAAFFDSLAGAGAR